MTYSINLVLPPQTRNVTHLHKHPFQVGNYNSCQDRLPRETGRAVLFGEWFSMWWFINLLLFLWWQTREITQCAEKQGYLLQGFQQLPQSNNGDHQNPSRDDASNLKDTHLPWTEPLLPPPVSQPAGCAWPFTGARDASWPPPLSSKLLREIRTTF